MPTNYLSIRDLREQSSRIFSGNDTEGEYVITNNGKPVAVLTSVSEENLEPVLQYVRRAKLTRTLSEIRKRHQQQPSGPLSELEIVEEVKKSRKER